MKFLIRFSLFSLTTLMFLLASCDSDLTMSLPEEEAPEAIAYSEGDGSGYSEHIENADEERITEHVNSLGVNLEEVEEIDFYFPDGSSEKRLLVEGDIVMTPEEFEGLLSSPDEVTSRQFRAYNLVNSPQIIMVKGYTGGGGYGLTSKMRTALTWAVANYNRLGTGLLLNLTFGGTTSSDEIVVYRNPMNTDTGGLAGYPSSNGAPYKWVQVWSGMDVFNTNLIEHVITHEIGHCLGLRHTDWFTQSSCGEYENEGADPEGAVHIPGTPTMDFSSIMLACFPPDTDGEFSYYDRVALRYLY